MKKMLVVDNIEMNKSILHEIFSPQYEIIQTSSSELAFKFLTQYKSNISIVLINEHIAKSLGSETVKTLASLKIFENVPIILILEGDSSKAKSINIELPYSEIIESPVNPHIVKKRVANLVELYSHKNELEALIEKQTAKILAQNKALKLQQRKINTINNDMLDTLSTVIEYRDVESGRHIHRIKKFTEVMLRALAVKYPKYNMTEEKINLIASASSLHDIGKIAIPDSILLSPRRLTYEEFNIMKEHTVKGCDLLNQLDSVEKNEYFTYCYDICRYHHEKYDGKGYPDGLKGDEIPIWAQVVAVADCYDALTSERPYKAAFTHEQAVEMIRTGACGQFSDEMMDCFGQVLSDFKKLAAEYADVNHADSSVSTGTEHRLSEENGEETSNKDIYRKMDRNDLIRTIENQKLEMLETRKKDSEILNKISDYVIEFDFEKDYCEERKGEFKNLFGYAPKNYSEAVMLFAELCPDEYHNKFVRTFRTDNLEKEIEKDNDRIVLECPMKIGGDIYVAVRCTAVPVVDNDKIIKAFMSIQILNYSSVTAGLDESNTDRDTVTGLWNYNGLRNEIEDYLSHIGKNGNHMLMLIDIDGFRSINRQTGYRFGNEILKDIAEVLKQQFSDSNIIGRVEDDNFIVFVNDCPDREECLSLVDNIFRCLHKSYTFDNKTYPEISSCIGVVDYPKHGRTFDELFLCASKAVDIAKINGKNMYLFYNENMKTNWELQVYNGSEEIQNKVVLEFERYFMPIIDSSSERITSYEVLETSSEYQESFDFDEMYSALYYSSNITAVSLNSLRRIFSVIWSLEQEEIVIPKLSVMTMFNGFDAETVIKAIEEILTYYPITCSNVCINISQDMIQSMDMRQVAEFADFLRSCGFEIGVYNVGLKSVNTKVFTSRLFNRITFANFFLDDVADGIIPVEILLCLMDCFTGLGVYTYMPMNADQELIKKLKQKADFSFGIHTGDFISVDSFKNSMREETVRPEYPALEVERNSLVISDKIYDEILEQTRSFIFEWIPRLDSVKFSGSFKRMYGYMPEMFDFVKNLKDSELIHPDDIRKFLEKLNFARSESSDAECLIRIYSLNKDDYVWNRVHFVAVRNAAGIPVKIMAVCNDISEERESYSEYTARKGRTDFITDLYSRSAAENKIKTYLYGEGVTGSHALIVAEISGFDLVEECFGKMFANAILKETAANLRDIFRDSDIIGRTDGSQFIIFVKGLNNTDTLIRKAEQISAAINNSYKTDDGEISVCAKLGISLYPDDGRSYEQLYSAALKALYYAKHSVNVHASFVIEDNPQKRLSE